MAAFQPYAGAFSDEQACYAWSCYATCRVYELRSFDDRLPAPPEGRKWVMKPQSAFGGLKLALLVDTSTSGFSQILAQVTPRARLVVTA